MSIQRYQIFDYAPDWSNGVEMKYSFNTGVYKSEQYKEQRKPMKALPCTNQSFTVLADQNNPEMIDVLRASLNKVLFVPIWTEPVQSTSSVDNHDGTITFQVPSLSIHFNFSNLCQYAIIVNTFGEQPSVLSQIMGYDSRGLILKPVVGSWDVYHSLIYPAMYAILDSIKDVSLTTEIGELQLSFNEFTPGNQAVTA